MDKKIKEELNDIICQSSSDYEILNNVYNYIEQLENIIENTTKHVKNLNSKGRGCEIYADVKANILKQLKIK